MRKAPAEGCVLAECVSGLEAMMAIVMCDECGNQVSGQSIFCVHCGRLFIADEELAELEQEADYKTPVLRRCKIIGRSCIAIMLIGAIFGVSPSGVALILIGAFGYLVALYGYLYIKLE